ncbi:tyrosine--tRNA ligase [Candidatus Parcubacteria bacterium]|nr:MAG: tyrosine--tRNA ligase [Candidatus Parcubacteria bacterium]
MTKINTDREKIQEILTRSVANIYPSKAFLEKMLVSGKQLTLYLGIDPTGPTLHIGHIIPMEKLRLFQELGHKIILLIGDFTGMIGDPTDKSATRQALSKEQVLQNAKDYKKQASTILNFSGTNKVELKYNSAWHGKMNFSKVMELSANFTVQQLLERDMFQERIKAGKPIHLHEFMYPVLQAYDSVAMDVDGEVGGNDQTFNMLSGRNLMKSLANKEKFVITTKLLVDPTGKKMGKSEGNMLSLNDSAKDMFGKVMSWTDGMIIDAYELCTRLPMTEINQIAKELKAGKNPRDYKFRLAQEIVALYHGEKKAKTAAAEFVEIFAKGGKPDDIKKYHIKTGSLNPVDILVELNFVSSKGEARRLIEGGGAKLNDEKIKNWKDNIQIKSGDIIQAGKRKFGQIE